MPSSKQRQYARFIPSEEVGVVTRWQFGSMDGGGLIAAGPQGQAGADLPVDVGEAALEAQQVLNQKACDDAYAQGVAHGQEQASLEWQRRMDEYVAGQGQEAARRLNGVLNTLEESLADMQQRMAQEVLLLACDIARQVVRQELSVNPNALQPVVREAVRLLVADGRPAFVRLNLADLETLAEPLREEYAGHPGVQWVADANVSAGGCLVESAGTVVDGSLDKRWQRAVAALGLQSAWQEEGDGH